MDPPSNFLPTPSRWVGKIQSANSSVNARQYIVDSGESYHLISRPLLTPSERRTLRRLIRPIPLQTANGIIVGKYEAEVSVRELGIKVKVVVLGDAPPVLSLGQLCRENNLRYVWDGPIPYLQDRTDSSQIVYCHPCNNVPIISVAEETDESSVESPTVKGPTHEMQNGEEVPTESPATGPADTSSPLTKTLKKVTRNQNSPS